MPITAREILDLPTIRADRGLSAAVLTLVEERDETIRFDTERNRYDLDGDAAAALEDRLSTLVKDEDVYDCGERCDSVEVVCLDGRPFGIVAFEEERSPFNGRSALLDCAALDVVVAAVKALRRDPTCDMGEEVDLDRDIAALLGFKGDSAPAPGL